ncbi:hypothetical protein EAH89_17870 [Roseomonas nepalensis]|uniref:Uncharacterized protein n=1 Tax=Muricoccus nepalensis TaxID=1854500 RepID=A0A502FSE1_9PROT|nr:hypothetical protein [Roseomonas nepalensis]TPG52438.1 hypothetical protein EAH89_17870 [Roseomonas nepalensis]
MATADEPFPQHPSWHPERTHTDWLRNTLAVSGPTEEVVRFAAAAAGTGVIPWVLDLAALEEEFLLPMAAPLDGVPAINLTGAKLLARRLREAVALNHQRALARMSTDRSCPLDLHRLLPLPAAILRLGPEEAASREWLLAHWGVTRPLRHVEVLPGKLDGRRKKMAELRVGFWSADWSPWQAVVRLRRSWPALAFVLTPDYAPGAADGQGASAAEARASEGSGSSVSRGRARRG